VFSALISTVCLFGGITNADDTEIFFSEPIGEEGTLPNIMFMFDTSGSMRYGDSSGVRRMVSLRKAMIDVVESAQNVNIGITTFSGNMKGGAVRTPTFGLDEDLCPEASCTELNVRSAVISNEDDARENNRGKILLDEKIIKLGSRRGYTALRFQNVNVPRGAKINSAKLEMTAVASEKRETTNITIKAEDVDDSAAFITEAYNISSRFEPNQSTLASAVWSVANWNYIDVPMSDLSSNIGNVIEEVVKRDGWCGGNSLTLLLTAEGERRLEAFDSSNLDENFPPALHINYDPSSVSFDDTCIRKTAKATISSGLDDVVENETSGVIDSINERLTVKNGGDTQKIGLRFPSLSVPQGATITYAELRLTSAGFTAGGADFDVMVENTSYANRINSSII